MAARPRFSRPFVCDIEGIIKDKRILETDFKAISIHDNWNEIENRIYHTFCELNHPAQRPIWLWEYFKLDTFSIVIEQPYKFLDQLVDNDETVWLFVNGDKDKFWFYEGN